MSKGGQKVGKLKEISSVHFSLLQSLAVGGSGCSCIGSRSVPEVSHSVCSFTMNLMRFPSEKCEPPALSLSALSLASRKRCCLNSSTVCQWQRFLCCHRMEFVHLRKNASSNNLKNSEIEITVQKFKALVYSYYFEL